MAPTTHNPSDQLTNAAKRLTTFKKPRRARQHYAYPWPALGLRQHQDQAKTASRHPSTSHAPHFSASFVPYTPPISLHAKIVSSTSTMPEDHVASLSVKEIAFISGGALVAAVLAGAVFITMRSIILKKARRLLNCRGHRIKKEKDPTECKRAIHDELDDPIWGTPLRVVYVEGIDNKPVSTGRSLSPETPSSSPSMSLWLPHSHREAEAAREEDSYRNRLEEDRESDIRPALALCNSSHDDPRQSVYLVASVDNASMGCPVNLANEVSPSSPIQGTDLASSHATVDGFSVSSSESSIPSFDSSQPEHFDDPEELEEIDVAYEIRRAHTQSIELKKGIFVAAYRQSVSNISVPLPSFVVSEAVPSLEPLDEENFAPLFSLRSTFSSKGSLATALSWSSIMRENSHGTIPSISNSFSTIHIEGWDPAEDSKRQLQPPVPYLMLTRPSDSSIYTSESESSSNVSSIDLCDFPLPPIPSKTPSYHSKFRDTLERIPRRV
ncbi:hypothetical protein H0H92_008870 [Tricholoma furcatifolium]|nr:hypothetical protein H0H92_008870 [Tricholoma furcatifolium]